MCGIKFSLFLLVVIGMTACGKSSQIEKDYSYKSASVEMLDAKDETGFYALPLKGELNNSDKYWSGGYWPLNKGNINLRWNSPVQDGWDYNSPSREELSVMVPAQIAELSPAEKFDLYRGRYDFPLRAEVYTRADRFAQDWEGICNGWAPASMNHNEPKPKTLVNPDGISIHFGSSDIKALLSYYYAFIHRVSDTKQMGRQCPRGSGWFNWNQDCKNELNAGSFHVVLANKVGKRNESFLVDIESKAVWNHPVASYESVVEGETDLPEIYPEGAMKALKMRTRVSYVNESLGNSWEPVRGTAQQTFIVKEYTYILFLNAFENIIGGEWTSGDRPDFLWLMGPTQSFTGLLEGMEPLLND
jgi:hypothetical protein